MTPRWACWGGRRGQVVEEPKRADDTDQRLHALRGSRILLVEDNDINQIVAGELLQDAGFIVDIADNGEIALDMLARIRQTMSAPRK